MRQYVFNDEEAKLLLEKLELTKFKQSVYINSSPDFHQLVNDIHRKFHYEVSVWLSKMGV